MVQLAALPHEFLFHSSPPHHLAAVARDWMGKYQGASQVALKPRSTEQVSAILHHCNERRLAVVPQVRFAR